MCTNAEAPGVQVLEAGTDERVPVPGRLVTRVEKLAAEVESWSAQWARVDGGQLRKVQRERLVAAAELLEAQAAALRRGLDG